MPPLNVLICGGGVAGPSLAFWLARLGHRVTIVERWSSLRASGAQIDLRAQGIDVVRRMGILDAIRARLVDEDGVAFVDRAGRVRGCVMANRTGRGAQSLTSEYEIMRGDLVRVLYEETHGKEGVEYVFGKTVERYEQHPEEQQVVAYFSDGTSASYDLLVGADGQGSRIRKAMLPEHAPDPYLHLGIYVAYWFIPREPADSNIRKTLIAPGGRMIHRRAHAPTQSHVYFFQRDDSPALRSLPRAPLADQKAFWAERFRDAGWQTVRFLKALEKTGGDTDNENDSTSFYCAEVVQVRVDSWSKGRVVLLGDAGYCPSPFTAMGTTASFVGAYVLAGEIARHPDDLGLALQKYEETLRPFVREIQKINPRMFRFAMPDTAFGVAVIYFVAWLATALRLPALFARFSRADKGGWKVPTYSELDKLAE